MLLRDPLFLLATAVCLVVLVILLIGIGSFGKGGEFNRKYANKLMQLRILAQGLAVVVIVLQILHNHLLLAVLIFLSKPILVQLKL